MKKNKNIYTILLMLVVFISTGLCEIQKEAETISSELYVTYKDPVPYQEINSYLKTGKKSDILNEIPNLSKIKEMDIKVYLLENYKSKDLPRFKFVKFEIQIEDSLEAASVSKTIETSRLQYDEMGYQELAWAIKSDITMTGTKADSLCETIKNKIKSASVCMKNENTAFIVFGEKLTQENADLLVKKLKKSGIDSVVRNLKYVEIDL